MFGVVGRLAGYAIGLAGPGAKVHRAAALRTERPIWIGRRDVGGFAANRTAHRSYLDRTCQIPVAAATPPPRRRAGPAIRVEDFVGKFSLSLNCAAVVIQSNCKSNFRDAVLTDTRDQPRRSLGGCGIDDKPEEAGYLVLSEGDWETKR